MARNVLGLAGALVASSFLASAASADPVAEAQQALEMWEPISVEMSQSSLMIIAKERRVTATIYNAMIGGICAFTSSGGATLSGVGEIVVLNRFRATGWVFEGGADDCKRLAKVPVSKLNIQIAGQSHMYACSSGRGCKY